MRFCAENITGLKALTEDMGGQFLRELVAVEERSCQRRSLSGRMGGAARSENVGISNVIQARNLNIEISKGSQATVIGLGLVGPKARLKGVVDGQQVNIPVQFNFRPSNTGGKSFSSHEGFGWIDKSLMD